MRPLWWLLVIPVAGVLALVLWHGAVMAWARMSRRRAQSVSTGRSSKDLRAMNEQPRRVPTGKDTAERATSARA
jgi:hypothetical protein